MSVTDIVEIRSELLRAEIAPAIGGRLTRLYHASGVDIVVPLTDTLFDPLVWPKAGAYPLIPYHNRIARGLLDFEGVELRLEPHPGEHPHSLHGPAQRRKWNITDLGGSSVALALDYAPDRDWPWAFHAMQRFTLAAGRLTVSLGVRNTGPAPMPTGLGWHPYLAAASATNDARFWWPHRADYLPTGQRIALESTSPILGPTAYLQDWRSATVRLHGGMDIQITVDPIFDHLVAHQGDTYVCIEPATHVANGFNLAAAGVAGTGMHVLAPGESLAGDIVLAIR